MKKTPIIYFYAIALLISGCASVPMQSSNENAEAKTFLIPKDMAKIYVYRNETLGSAIKIKLSLDDEYMGQNAPNTFHMWSEARQAQN